jgi:putative zinc finger/helix-turn-helix YgiT family protein
MNKCAMCENGKMKKTMVEWTRTVDGTRFVGTMPGYVCDSCKEEYVDAIVLEKFEEQIALEIARRGRISSEAFRFMRTTIGLSSKELAKILGVQPETVSRWEHRKREIDKSVFALLGGLVSESVKAQHIPISGILAAIQKPVRKQTVFLKVA